MPLLKRGPEVFPQGLFDVPPEDLPWTVAHTRSRQEKLLARQLEAQGVAFYLPQFTRRVRRSSREFVSYIPLFAGYLFVRADPPSRDAVYRNPLVVRLLEVRDQQLLHQELGQLRALQESGAELIPYARIRPGDCVRVAEGPFRGYRGHVLRTQSGLRLIVSISMLSQSVAVEFGRESLIREPQDAATGTGPSAVA